MKCSGKRQWVLRTRIMRVYLLDFRAGQSHKGSSHGEGRWKSVVMLPDEIWDFAERLRAEAVPVVDRHQRCRSGRRAQGGRFAGDPRRQGD